MYKNLILSRYISDTPLNISDYHYSYEYNNAIKRKVLHQLIGASTNNLDCVFTCNATSAICCIADYLKKQGYQKICVLEPAYFSAYACLSSFDLNVCKETITPDSTGNIEVPYDSIIQKRYDVVWITSPIFSTGIYFTQKQISSLNALLQKGILLVIDESASAPNCALTPSLLPSENIISIFSPHKYLALNSVKFAAIICTNSVCEYFEDWIDVFIGALPLSSYTAINHYLSSNYNLCLNIHDKYIKSNIQQVQELCYLFPDNYYNGTVSNYITMRNKKLSYINSLKYIDIFSIMKQTHVSFIPGYINGFTENWGFCYRINLTLDIHILKNYLGRLFSYFA